MNWEYVLKLVVEYWFLSALLLFFLLRYLIKKTFILIDFFTIQQELNKMDSHSIKNYPNNILKIPTNIGVSELESLKREYRGLFIIIKMKIGEKMYTDLINIFKVK